jgi:hypothetical protein
LVTALQTLTIIRKNEQSSLSLIKISKKIYKDKKVSFALYLSERADSSISRQWKKKKLA